MGDRKPLKILIAVGLWLGVIVIIAVVYRFLVAPQQQRRLVVDTSADSSYQHVVNLAADSFSGYAVLRSDALARDLATQSIKLNIVDDAADYTARIDALKRQEVNMAVFTIDSYILAGAKLGEYPGSIVLVIDESKGIDGVVANKKVFSDINALNRPETKFVFVPNSPSEFMARVIVAEYNLPLLTDVWWEESTSAEDTYQRFRTQGADNTKPRVYAVWDPFLSKALGEPNAQLLLDSSKLSGYIVDVLVVERTFLRDNPELVNTVLAAYLRALYSYGSDGMGALIKQDASQFGNQTLSDSQAKDIASRVVLRNTLENYDQFGLNKSGEPSKLPKLEDVIAKITRVLIKTRAVDADPLNGQYNSLFFQDPLRNLQTAGFNPTQRLGVISGASPGQVANETVRTGPQLKPLTDEQWNNLLPVGDMRIDSVSFARGTARLNVQSERDLAELATRLASFPQYYLKVVGKTTAEGDAEANRQLAQDRADAVTDKLKQVSVDPIRIKATAQSGAGEQAVTFVLCQMAY